MNKNILVQRKEENRQAFTIAFIYALSCKLFKSSLMQYIPQFDSVFMLFTALSVLFMFGYIMHQYRNRDFSRDVSLLVILFLSTLVWGMLFHGQIGYYSIRGISMNTGPLMVIIFFFLKKYNISMRVLVKAIIIACSMYCIAYLLGTITFPNQIFGYDSNSDKQDSIIGSEQQRGVLRLFIFGSQIIPLTIFWVLTYYKNNKRYYFWFVPLFIFLIIQGARTPLFMCFLVVLGYFVFSVKQKILAVLLSIVIAFSIPLLYDKILESNSDDIITNYVKLTQQQLENNENEDDIRLEMSKYMFSEFNDSNILQSIFGNGFPDAKSNYSTKLMTLSSNRYYFLSDVGITQIFIYMGFVGLIIYTIVFYRGIKTKVPQKYEFGRLFLVYYALISFTNNAMVEFGMFTFGLALYSIFRANYEMQLESKKNDRISCK